MVMMIKFWLERCSPTWMNLLVNIDMNIHLQYKRKRNNHYSCNVWDQLNDGISNEKNSFFVYCCPFSCCYMAFYGCCFCNNLDFLLLFSNVWFLNDWVQSPFFITQIYFFIVGRGLVLHIPWWQFLYFCFNLDSPV